MRMKCDNFDNNKFLSAEQEHQEHKICLYQNTTLILTLLYKLVICCHLKFKILLSVLLSVGKSHY
jgi:hypothetical protein